MLHHCANIFLTFYFANDIYLYHEWIYGFPEEAVNSHNFINILNELKYNLPG